MPSPQGRRGVGPKWDRVANPGVRRSVGARYTEANPGVRRGDGARWYREANLGHTGLQRTRIGDRVEVAREVTGCLLLTILKVWHSSLKTLW